MTNVQITAICLATGFSCGAFTRALTYLVKYLPPLRYQPKYDPERFRLIKWADAPALQKPYKTTARNAETTTNFS